MGWAFSADFCFFCPLLQLQLFTCHFLVVLSVWTCQQLSHPPSSGTTVSCSKSVLYHIVISWVEWNFAHPLGSVAKPLRKIYHFLRPFITMFILKFQLFILNFFLHFWHNFAENSMISLVADNLHDSYVLMRLCVDVRRVGRNKCYPCDHVYLFMWVESWITLGKC